MTAVAGRALRLARRALRRAGQVRAFTVLLVILIALVACGFLFDAQKVNDIQGDFCDYLAVHRRAAELLPQVRARRIGEQDDSRLLVKLGCR